MTYTLESVVLYFSKESLPVKKCLSSDNKILSVSAQEHRHTEKNCRSLGLLGMMHLEGSVSMMHNLCKSHNTVHLKGTIQVTFFPNIGDRQGHNCEKGKAFNSEQKLSLIITTKWSQSKSITLYVNVQSYVWLMSGVLYL